MTEKITIEVSDTDVAIEIALGIIGRANDIHDNTDNESEEVAIELRDIGQELYGDYVNYADAENL